MSEGQKKTLGIAIASLVCGCCFFLPLIGLLASPAALILGIVAVNKISKNQEMLKGRGLAIAGIVLGSLGLLCFVLGLGVVLPRIATRTQQARNNAMARSDVEANLPIALKFYELDSGRFPTQEEGLDALIEKPSSASNWNGPYLERAILDPWGREYVYQFPGLHRPDGFDLYSIGKDGQPSTEDDIVNWE